MINVPTDLLRTFIAVTDLRSFTRAAQALGVTQPAVSAQIKRLQMLLGAELFDKSAPGVTLTAKGEVIVNYARRAARAQRPDARRHDARRPGGAAAHRARGRLLSKGRSCARSRRFRSTHPDLRLQISSEPSASLLRDLRRGDYDLVVAASDTEQPESPNRRWLEPSGWGAASAAVVQGEGPVPLLVVGESSLSRRLSVSALERAGQDYQIVYVGGELRRPGPGRARQGSASPAGRGAACVEAGCRCSTACRGLPGGCRTSMAASICAKASTSPRSSELADTIVAAVGESGYGCRLPRSRAAGCKACGAIYRQPCAKPERCAQPVMRASSIAISAYITMPSTASASRPAKISGT